MSTTTTHNTTTTNDAGFPPAPGENHQKTNFESVTDTPTYFAHIDFVSAPDQIPCTCSDCAWKGMADALATIGDCSLTPGDESPAGRCPECDSLAYIDQPDPKALQTTIRNLLAYIEQNLGEVPTFTQGTVQ
jgi:hypothetical protein